MRQLWQFLFNLRDFWLKMRDSIGNSTSNNLE